MCPIYYILYIHHESQTKLSLLLSQIHCDNPINKISQVCILYIIMCTIYFVLCTIYSTYIYYNILSSSHNSFLSLSHPHPHTYIYHLSQKTNKIVVTPLLSIVSIPSEKFSRYVYYINIIMCPVYYIYSILYTPCNVYRIDIHYSTYS